MSAVNDDRPSGGARGMRGELRCEGMGTRTVHLNPHVDVVF